jgi:hypothetical protein
MQHATHGVERADVALAFGGIAFIGGFRAPLEIVELPLQGAIQSSGYFRRRRLQPHALAGSPKRAPPPCKGHVLWCH